MKCEPEIDTPFSFDGPEIYNSTGCEIHWKDGKNLTQQLVKQKNPENGQLMFEFILIILKKKFPTDQQKIVSSETFFNFFNPPELPVDENDKDYEEINVRL